MANDNIIYLFDKEELENTEFQEILSDFVMHLKESKDVEETCRIYINIAARAWIQEVGYAKVRQNLFGLIVVLDEKGEFD